MNNTIRYNEEFGYNLDCESCCDKEGTCIGCEAAINEEEGEASVRADYISILSDIKDARGSIQPCVEMLISHVVTHCGILRCDISYVILDRNEIEVCSHDDIWYSVSCKGLTVVGIHYNEFILRLNNVYRGLTNLGEGLPFTHPYILPLDGHVSILPDEKGSFSFSYLHEEGELIRDISPSYLQEIYMHFLWLDRYHMDIEYHLYGHETSKDSNLNRWYDLEYMTNLE